MRWYSTPESFEKGEVTWLALFELVVAVVLHVGIAVYFETFVHVAVGALLAPFLLLRTRQATKWGADWLEGYDNVSTKILAMEIGTILDNLIRVFLAVTVILLPLTSLVIRVVSVTAGAACHPLEALKSIPRNWQRLTLCVDSAHVPELVPGIEARYREARYRFADATNLNLRTFHESRKAKGLSMPMLASTWTTLMGPVRTETKKWGIRAMFVFPFVFGPSLVYRISFKGVSLVYAPLVWISYRASGSGFQSFRTQLKHLRDNDFETLRRWWAGVLLLASAFKIGHLAGFVSLSELGAQVKIDQLMQLFVLPDQIPPWQISTLVKCLLTFVLFWLSGAALFRIDKVKRPWPETRVSNTITSIDFTRRTLALYNLMCGLYIILVTGFELPLPQLGESLFPPFGEVWDFVRGRLLG